MTTEEKDLISSVLAQMDKSTPIVVDERGFSYFFLKQNPSFWKVRKVDETVLAAEYELRTNKGGWTCNCPAGGFGRLCKHKVWISFIAKHN